MGKSQRQRSQNNGKNSQDDEKTKQKGQMREDVV